MKAEYDFSKAKRNPYANHVRKAVSIRLDTTAIDYFKLLAEETGVPYQSLINMYLLECAAEHKRPAFPQGRLSVEGFGRLPTAVSQDQSGGRACRDLPGPVGLDRLDHRCKARPAIAGHHRRDRAVVNRASPSIHDSTACGLSRPCRASIPGANRKSGGVAAFELPHLAQRGHGFQQQGHLRDVSALEALGETFGGADPRRGGKAPRAVPGSARGWMAARGASRPWLSCRNQPFRVWIDPPGSRESSLTDSGTTGAASAPALAPLRRHGRH